MKNSSFWRGFFLLSGLLTLGGCVASPFNGKPMTDRIVLDTLDFNKAYSEAANAQLLLNILYSRDRLPRRYAGLKDITTTQKRSLSISPTIGSLGLGNPATNAGGAKFWGVGQLGASGSAEASPGYGISPLVGEDLVEGALNPIDEKIFRQYWDSGWPKDVLMAVLVSNVTRIEKTNSEETTSGARYANSAEDLKDENDTTFMAFARWLHKSDPKPEATLKYRVLEPKPKKKILQVDALKRNMTTHEFNHVATALKDAKEAGFSAKFEKSGNQIALTKAASGAKHLILTVKTPKVGGITRCHDLKMCEQISPDGLWELELRSFDQAIYYLGELVRGNLDADTKAYGPDWVVTAADCKNELSTNKAPLFRVRRESSPIWVLGRAYPTDGAIGAVDGDDPIWSARVKYRGGWYFAGPGSAIDAGCGDEKPKPKPIVDRSGTVLTLLGQIFEMNRSAESVILPARIQ